MKSDTRRIKRPQQSVAIPTGVALNLNATPQDNNFWRIVKKMCTPALPALLYASYTYTYIYTLQQLYLYVDKTI